MAPAPIPPHERPWRHPSELGSPAHEPTSTTGRVLIVTTASVGLLLIGLLALTITPRQDEPPIAVSSTSERVDTRPAALERPQVPMVTPLGDDGWGITTALASSNRDRRMAARLPGGSVIDVRIVRRDEESGLTLVSLPTRTDGYHLAADEPAPDDTVVVHGSEPVIVAMADIAGLDVAEGTPILDGHGDLVGICTWERDAVAVMSITTMPGATTTTPSTTPPTQSTRPTTPATEPTTPTTTGGTGEPATTVTTSPPATTTTAPDATTAPPTATTTPPTTTPATTGSTATGNVSGDASSTTAPG